MESKLLIRASLNGVEYPFSDVYNLIGSHATSPSVLTVTVTLDRLYLVHGVAIYVEKTYLVPIEEAIIRVGPTNDADKSR